MSDREGGPGGTSLPDEELSLPKATVAKMITGTRTRAFDSVLLIVYLIVICRFTAGRCDLCKRNPRPHNRVLRRWELAFINICVSNILRSEFIHLISSEANEICDQESKKTIAPEHIIGALKVCYTSWHAKKAAVYNFPAPRFRFIYHGSRRCFKGPQAASQGMS